MPVWDLSKKQNWNLILTERRIATMKTEPTFGKYFHNPIQPIYTNPNSTVLLVGTYSETAKAHWYLGARVKQFLYVSPSLNTNLISGVQTAKYERAALKQLTLIRFPNYNIFPYVLQLDIPRWLQDIYVEVWEYIGVIDDLVYQCNLEEVLKRLDKIEGKIDSIFSSKLVNSSSDFDNPDSSAHLGII